MIPSQYGTHSEQGSRKRISRGAESRSRVWVEVEQMWQKYCIRSQFRELLRSHDASVLTRRPQGFATYDGLKRASAHTDLNVLSLLDAADKVDDEEAKSKAQASMGLEALATASDLVPVQPGTKSRLGPLNKHTEQEMGGHMVLPVAHSEIRGHNGRVPSVQKGPGAELER